MKSECTNLDFFTFEKLFRKNNLLMGLGSHKTLDYLSLGLNLPLSYHPQTIFSKKYIKIYLDFMRKGIRLNDYFNNDETKIAILRAVNDSYFTNSRLYQADRNEDHFQRYSGITPFQTAPIIFKTR